MGKKGISPLIASVFVILLGVTILGISLGVINPTFRRAKDTAIVNDAFHTLETLNAAIKEVASEPDGSKRVVPIVVSEGTLRVNTTYDWLYFDYDPMEPLTISGTKGDIYIVRGLEFADWFNYYADGSVATPIWTNTSGQAAISSGAYSITNGTSYHNVSGPLENWKFGATITNVSGPSGGQVFVLPTNPENLIVFWTFDQADNTTNVMDYSGNGNYGTWLNGTNVTGGKIGNSYSGYWPDPKGYVQSSSLKYKGQSFTAGSLNNFTISAWIYPANTASREQHIAEFSGTQFYISVSKLGTSATFKSRGVTALTPNAWNHVAITGNNADGNVSLYLNGKLDNSTVGNTINIATTIFEAGDLYAHSGNYNFNGTIDEVMSFNRSLSGDEIQALYETSAKKLLATGTQSITAKTTPAIMLSNPAGKTSFDGVTVVRERNELKMIVPYANVDLNGTLRLSKGEHKVQIRHMDTNDATSRPIVELTPA